jgi:hypothetical protein
LVIDAAIGRAFIRLLVSPPCGRYLPLEQGALERAQELAPHDSPRATKLYQLAQERLTQHEEESLSAISPDSSRR